MAKSLVLQLIMYNIAVAKHELKIEVNTVGDVVDTLKALGELRMTSV